MRKIAIISPLVFVLNLPLFTGTHMYLPPIATTTRAAYNNCHPDIPLQADDLRYVDLSTARGNQNFVESLSEAIDWSQDVAPPYHQRLFTGHRGSGKTTELFRLKKKLEQLGFLVLYLDVEQKLDLEDIEYTDLLLSMMTGLFEQAKAENLALSEILLKAIHDWFYERTETETQEKESDSEIMTQAGIGGMLPLVVDLFASWTARVKVGSSHKVEIRKVLERDLAVFNDRLNAVIREVRKQAQVKGFRDLVIIADGLEKMPFKMRDGRSNHDLLFVENAERLKVPECHLIYTVPISLAYNANLNSSFGGDYVAVIPMVKLSVENCALFQVLIEKRIDVNIVFESPKEVLENLIAASGGAVRDLMRLIRIACQGAKQVTTADVERAKTTLMIEYDRLLREEDFKILQEVYLNKEVAANDKYGRLLHWRVLHEYLNGKRWADVHPLVLRIERVQRLLKSESEG